MEKRRARRWPRQLEVHFTPQGKGAPPHRGMAGNLSATGIFVRSNVVLPRGSRLRLEVFGGHTRGGSFVAEGVVVRAQRSPLHLQDVKPSGMGVRFLTVQELVAELLPGMVAPPGPRPAAEEEGRASAVAVGEGGAFQLRFRSPEELRSTLRRDVRTGGLFVPTSGPPPGRDRTVQVQVSLDGSERSVVIEGRVVHRVEADPAAEGDSLIVGMGLQLADAAEAIRRLEGLLA